ncbi:hypothetical protein D3C72_1751990 [compost metagenome]
MQRLGIGDGVRGVRAQRQAGHQALALRAGHERQQQLAAGAAVQRHPRPRLQVHAQRPLRFHAVQVDHVVAGQHGQVAGLTDLVDQLLQDRMARRRRTCLHQHIDGQLPHARRALVVAVAGSARHQPSAFKLLEDAVDGLLRQLDRLHDGRQRQRSVGRGQDLENAEGAHGGGIRMIAHGSNLKDSGTHGRPEN